MLGERVDLARKPLRLHRTSSLTPESGLSAVESVLLFTRVLEKAVWDEESPQRRKMTGALLVWGVLISLWIASGTSALAIMTGALGLIVLSGIWWSTRPLWRQGHGARLRRIRSVDLPVNPGTR